MTNLVAVNLISIFTSFSVDTFFFLEKNSSLTYTVSVSKGLDIENQDCISDKLVFRALIELDQ